MPIKFYSEAYFFQAWGSLTSLKSQTRDSLLKVPPGGLFTSWKNPSTSAGFESPKLGSRGEHVTPRPPRSTHDDGWQNNILLFLLTLFYTTYHSFWGSYGPHIGTRTQLEGLPWPGQQSPEASPAENTGQNMDKGHKTYVIDWLIGMFLFSSSGLMEKDVVEVFYHYGVYLSSSFMM